MASPPVEICSCGELNCRTDHYQQWPDAIETLTEEPGGGGGEGYFTGAERVA